LKERLAPARQNDWPQLGKNVQLNSILFGLFARLMRKKHDRLMTTCLHRRSTIFKV